MTAHATKIHTSQMGTSGPFVSRFGLGTMTFGSETDEAEAHRELDAFVDHGGTFIDTADVYGGGASEAIIGRWGNQRGGLDDLIVATKGRFAPAAGSSGASRRSLVRSVDASLKRLQTEAIDVYFIHGWDRDVALTDTLGTLGDLVSVGKIHNIAWSNVTGWQLQKILTTAELGGFPIPVAVQPQYNLLDRGIELEVLPCCLDNGIALTPWSPLGGGWLTGKYSSDTRPTGTSRLGEDPGRGVEAYDLRNNDRTHAILDALRTMAARYNRPIAHLALAWLAARPGVVSVLLGARTVKQLTDNLAAGDFVLSDAERSELDDISSVGLPAYPYRFVEEWCDVAVWRQLGT
ncbi:MAG: aldo/keto reductase [Alphaproteobacteria bacterium]|nr:aldo/keto reductase [Alphaproteobacteria bacterium]